MPQEKDDTDTAALRESWQRSFQISHIYEGVGDRLDRILANTNALQPASQETLIGRYNSKTCALVSSRNRLLRVLMKEALSEF